MAMTKAKSKLIVKGTLPATVTGKRKRTVEPGHDEDQNAEDYDSSSDKEEDSVSSSAESGEDESSADDDEVIASMRNSRKKKKKIKSTLLTPEDFGNSLTRLLALPPAPSHVPNTAPSHLLPTKRGPLKPTKLEKDARSLVRQEKRELEEKGWIKDVIGGWSGEVEWSGRPLLMEGDHGEGAAEREKRLKRLAQKGVVRLFNAVRAAQGVRDVDEEEERPKKQRKMEKEVKKKEEVVDENLKSVQVGANSKGFNVLGTKGKAEALANLSKANFLQLLRQGARG